MIMLRIGLMIFIFGCLCEKAWAFQKTAYDTLQGKIYEKESLEPLSNARIEIEGYKHFKTITDENGKFTFVLPPFLSTQTSLKLLVKVSQNNTPFPIQIRCTIDPRKKFINIPLKLSSANKTQAKTQNEHNHKQNNIPKVDSLNKSDRRLAPENQNDSYSKDQENTSFETMDTEKTLVNKKIYTDDELADYLEYSDQRLRQIEFQKKSDSIFIEQYYDIIGEIQRIDIQLSDYEYLDNFVKKRLIHQIDTLEQKLKNLSDQITYKNKLHQMMIDKAQQEINQLRHLLDNKSAYLLLDKKLSISLLIAFCLTVLFLVFMIFLLWNIKKQKNILVQQNHQILDQRNKLQTLSESLKNTLASREILLKEVHHRVKNNLQIIWGLLFLQSKKVQEEKAAWALENSQNRVYSIALVHEKLYQSQNLAEINFCNYLQALIQSISETYEQEGKEITFDLDIIPKSFSVDHTMRLGLIINELVSNIFKYAFPHQEQGKVKIQLKNPDANLYELTVRDNGIGMPSNLDTKHSEGLGLTLVDLLSKELRGQVKYERTKGTKISIYFKELQKNDYAKG